MKPRCDTISFLPFPPISSDKELMSISIVSVQSFLYKSNEQRHHLEIQQIHYTDVKREYSISITSLTYCQCVCYTADTCDLLWFWQLETCNTWVVLQPTYKKRHKLAYEYLSRHSSTCICSAFNRFFTIKSIFLLLFAARIYFSKNGNRPCNCVSEGKIDKTSLALMCDPWCASKSNAGWINGSCWLLGFRYTFNRVKYISSPFLESTRNIFVQYLIPYH